MIEYIKWQRQSRHIPQEDQSEFYDQPLPHITIYRYQTERLTLPSHRSHFSLKFTLAGEEHYSFGRRRVCLDAGSALFSNDGGEHDSSVSQHTDALSIYVPPNKAQALLNVASTTPDNALDAPSVPALGREVPQIVFTPSSRTNSVLQAFLHSCPQRCFEANDERFEALSLRLAEHALRDVFRQAPPWALRDVTKPSVREELITRVLRARVFLDDTFGARYDLDVLAEVACLSKYHLIRTFAEVVGKTPGAYARSRRLNKARQVLEDGGNWSRAARVAGYSSTRRFKDAFHRQFGHGADLHTLN